MFQKERIMTSTPFIITVIIYYIFETHFEKCLKKIDSSFLLLIIYENIDFITIYLVKYTDLLKQILYYIFLGLADWHNVCHRNSKNL